MHRDEAEESILDHETLSNTTFVTNYLSYAFSNRHASNFGYLLFVLSLNEANKPHFPHIDEFFNVNEVMNLHICFQFTQFFMFELFPTFLCTYNNHVVISNTVKEKLWLVLKC